MEQSSFQKLKSFFLKLIGHIIDLIVFYKSLVGIFTIHVKLKKSAQLMSKLTNILDYKVLKFP